MSEAKHNAGPTAVGSGRIAATGTECNSTVYEEILSLFEERRATMAMLKFVKGAEKEVKVAERRLAEEEKGADSDGSDWTIVPNVEGKLSLRDKS
ncbi:hypothetical protein N7523_005786 [Penicillium sp. IBT 18751x]|nr:hypothetical protein N7523_005623 [Penicillium sp. IBT 18751x]KAJ6118035.1 hypothetical protein N7523_005786 [Penicillium sp. IBT 18751x]